MSGILAHRINQSTHILHKRALASTMARMHREHESEIIACRPEGLVVGRYQRWKLLIGVVPGQRYRAEPVTTHPVKLPDRLIQIEARSRGRHSEQPTRSSGYHVRHVPVI